MLICKDSTIKLISTSSTIGENLVHVRLVATLKRLRLYSARPDAPSSARLVQPLRRYNEHTRLCVRVHTQALRAAGQGTRAHTRQGRHEEKEVWKFITRFLPLGRPPPRSSLPQSTPLHLTDRTTKVYYPSSSYSRAPRHIS